MHPEHAEHHATRRTLRLEARDMKELTLVVRCGGIFRLRLRLAMWLFRLAGRIAGFKRVQIVQTTSAAR